MYVFVHSRKDTFFLERMFFVFFSKKKRDTLQAIGIVGIQGSFYCSARFILWLFF